MDFLDEAYLVFSDCSDNVPAVYKYMRKGFQHVSVVSKDAFNWIIINPTMLYPYIEVPPLESDCFPFNDVLTNHETVIKLTFLERDCSQRYGIFGLMTCVSFVKYLLGLRINSITPYQLYKRLINLSDADKKRCYIKDVEIIKYGKRS